MFQWKNFILRTLSYVLVAAVSAFAAIMLWGGGFSKLAALERLIENRFIGQADMDEARDAAAAAMVDALGDKWSYYISAEEYSAAQERKNNTYVGVGFAISQREDGTGLDIESVEPGSSAEEQGILPGDILIEADGQSVAGMTNSQVSQIISGEKGTTVEVGVLRNGEKLTFTLERQSLRIEAAKGQLLEGGIGLIRIENFFANSASETIAVIKDLQAQGAQKLIFDVRNNPGGYIVQMTKVLDYLLPEGVVYREEDYTGRSDQIKSDASCLELPIAVLVNKRSYSSAEFFAAVLQEYDWATIVGQHTTGKGYYQNTIALPDGSAVNLSVGKYCTPSGVNLMEVGGITPDVESLVDDETDAYIYYDLISPAEDPQIQAAVQFLNKTAD